ncbi:hypothetical protein HNY73_001850 [Argiope bruennichi]|uniref:Uncharacterized protein n=1 Tax=Argiope bruennichi TaxID=94029 RepID=A0A8T0FRU8_ARGBR|nr:hypothetical protein HNY73_001850 [Argiope bruennichi]
MFLLRSRSRQGIIAKHAVTMSFGGRLKITRQVSDSDGGESWGYHQMCIDSNNNAAISRPDKKSDEAITTESPSDEDTSNIRQKIEEFSKLSMKGQNDLYRCSWESSKMLRIPGKLEIFHSSASLLELCVSRKRAKSPNVAARKVAPRLY